MKGLSSKGGNAYALKNGYVDAQKENSAEKFIKNWKKLFLKPCTDERKVSFYKWGVKYWKRGQKGGNVKGKTVWDREKMQIKNYENAAKRDWFLKQVKKKS